MSGPRSMRTHQSTKYPQWTLATKLGILTVRPYIWGNVGKCMCWYKICI